MPAEELVVDSLAGSQARQLKNPAQKIGTGAPGRGAAPARSGRGALLALLRDGAAARRVAVGLSSEAEAPRGSVPAGCRCPRSLPARRAARAGQEQEEGRELRSRLAAAERSVTLGQMQALWKEVGVRKERTRELERRLCETKKQDEDTASNCFMLDSIVQVPDESGQVGRRLYRPAGELK